MKVAPSGLVRISKHSAEADGSTGTSGASSGQATAPALPTPTGSYVARLRTVVNQAQAPVGPTPATPRPCRAIDTGAHGSQKPQRGSAWQAAACATPGAILARASTNNLARSLSDYQNTGRFRFDRSWNSCRSLWLSTVSQGAVTFGIRRQLQNMLGTTDGEQSPFTWGVNLVAGGLGGMFTHPAHVRLFAPLPARPDTSVTSPLRRLAPVAADLVHVARHKPSMLLVGLETSFLLNGVDWMIYFGLQDALGDSAAAFTAVVCGTPLFQIYARQMSKQTSLQQAVTSLYLCRGGTATARKAGAPGAFRVWVSGAGFLVVGVAVMRILDSSQSVVEQWWRGNKS